MITRYAPTDRFRILDRWASKLLDEVFEEGEMRRGWSPLADIKETETDFTFTVELPGIKQEDIEIEMVGDVLTIRGSREFYSDEKKDDYVRIERSFGTFQRSFTLGVPVDADRITATYRDGILRVNVPKAPEVHPKRIKINTN